MRRPAPDIASAADRIYIKGLGIVAVVIHFRECPAVNAVALINWREQSLSNSLSGGGYSGKKCRLASVIAGPAVDRVRLALRLITAIATSLHAP